MNQVGEDQSTLANKEMPQQNLTLSHLGFQVYAAASLNLLKQQAFISLTDCSMDATKVIDLSSKNLLSRRDQILGSKILSLQQYYFGQLGINLPLKERSIAYECLKQLDFVDMTYQKKVMDSVGVEKLFVPKCLLKPSPFTQEEFFLL